MANTLRISGLASGMDIDKIVSDLMKAERMPLDKLKQKKQLLEWQRDDYRAMNTLLQGLDDYLFSNITLQSSMLKKNCLEFERIGRHSDGGIECGERGDDDASKPSGHIGRLAVGCRRESGQGEFFRCR